MVDVPLAHRRSTLKVRAAVPESCGLPERRMWWPGTGPAQQGHRRLRRGQNSLATNWRSHELRQLAWGFQRRHVGRAHHPLTQDPRVTVKCTPGCARAPGLPLPLEQDVPAGCANEESVWAVTPSTSRPRNTAPLGLSVADPHHAPLDCSGVALSHSP